MRRKRFKLEQIVKILREVEGGLPVAEVIRRHNIAEVTFYRWKRKYGGMDLSEARRLKVLEQENARLKRRLAEAILEIDLLKEISSKNW